jgi:hypothetical protein
LRTPDRSRGHGRSLRSRYPRRRRRCRGLGLGFERVGGAYIYKQAVTPPPRTPEETITEFLTAVFLAKDATRVSAVVCASWDPVDALERTAKEVDARATVSWDEIRLLSATEDRVSARARLGLRLRDDNQPAFYRQWRFSLVQENGWRVCEARPFVV